MILPIPLWSNSPNWQVKKPRHTELLNYLPLKLTEEASDTSGNETQQTSGFLGPNLYKIIIPPPIPGLSNTSISKYSSNSKTSDILYTDLHISAT